eukprot:2886219-Amphidinium_carterae.1
MSAHSATSTQPPRLAIQHKTRSKLVPGCNSIHLLHNDDHSRVNLDRIEIGDATLGLPYWGV